jgi:5'-3' exonuclease
MGIPSYFSYIIKNYSNIIRNCKQIVNDSVCFQYLYMDCNSIIYDEFRKLEDEFAKDKFSVESLEKVLIQNIITKIGSYLEYIQPSELVYIAFDGVAPFAKMNQQRNRRHKSNILKKIQDAISKDSKPSLWSTSNITPGTPFMNQLSVRVKKAFSNLEEHYKVREIIVSGSDEHGEGEHKMFQHIRDHKDHIRGTIAVYGLDSDLIMLSLFHCKYFQNMFIFRETPEFGKQLIEQSQDSKYLFIDIPIFAKAILTEMNCEVYDDHHRLYDYIFMCFFLGNDFLPHFPSLNIRTVGIDVLLDLYRKQLGKHKQRTFISESLQIQWKWVFGFISELAKNERERLIIEYDIKMKFSKRNWSMSNEKDKEFLVESVPVLYKPEENYISPQHPYWETRYYKSLFHENVNIQNVCVNYIEGLEWVFRYYTNNCPDWKWHYKYHYPPLFKDLCKYIPKKEQLFLENVGSPFSPYVQLAYVLPQNNHHLLPEKIQKILTQTNFYHSDCKYQWAFCRYFWEAHAILPEIPLHILEKWNKEWN